jgi:hypothetical protein
LPESLLDRIVFRVTMAFGTGLARITPLPADASGAVGVLRPLLFATLNATRLSVTPAPEWSARAIPQPPKFLLAMLNTTLLCLAGVPRSSATLTPTPLPFALLPNATECEVLFRSMPEPRFPVTTFLMILTWLAATGPCGPRPTVTIPSAGPFVVSLAFTTVRPTTVAYEALTPTPYGWPVASIFAPGLPDRITRRSRFTPPGYVPLQTTTVALSFAASIASWIELYFACLQESPDLFAEPLCET